MAQEDENNVYSIEYEPPLTVKSKSSLVMSLNDIMINEPECHDWKRSPVAKAFCIDCSYTQKNVYKGKVYRVGAKRVSVLIENPKDGWLCPFCNHAVTYYSDYREIDESC